MTANITLVHDIDFFHNAMAIRLRQRRIDIKLTVRELSEAVDFSVDTIYAYEKGNREPSPSNMLALVEALGVSARWIVRGVDDEVCTLNPITPFLHPVITQTKACLIAYMDSGMKAHDLVNAAITLLDTSAHVTDSPQKVEFSIEKI